MKECLELRLSLIAKNYSLKDEYEKNEIDILKMETENKIIRLENLLQLRRTEFNQTYDCLIEELKHIDNLKDNE
jgi:hypothetical protein